MQRCRDSQTTGVLQINSPTKAGVKVAVLNQGTQEEEGS